MSLVKSPPDSKFPDSHHDIYSKTIFGFWIYLLSDFILFATFFAVYIVLHHSAFLGASAAEFFEMPFILSQTLLFLTSSFTVGMGGVYAHRKNKKGIMICFGITFLLGAIFLVREYMDLSHLVNLGYIWERNAFLTGFFSLLGLHAAHLFFALLWIFVLLIPIFRKEVDPVSIRRLTCLRMFWQFLNVIWVFIFTIVYLMGGYLA